ncbi:TetR family transcriptional regulator [Streptomyces wedmorensis]|uniref:TetR/AcrR family transcriptional regulator n=1 Tax=Streptomyces wedmorensis TaxID=43759 RepID=UPI0034388E46
MAETGGLRELKKRRMYERLSDVAIGLFVERGFEEVTVADVAAAVEVSKPTLFRYFPTKEDLVLHRLADHEGEAGRVVAGRPEGCSPLEALRGHFLEGLARRDAVTGLNDDEGVLAFHRLVYGTPSVVARLHAYVERNEEILAGALGGGVAGRLAAGQVVAVQRVLARENWRRITGGDSADGLYPEAVAVASEAFDQLGSGVALLS